MSLDTKEQPSGSPPEGRGSDAGHLNPSGDLSSVYETKYQKSLRHYLTREALPSENHYRSLGSIVGLDGTSVRPTMDELHNNTYVGRSEVS